MRRELRSAATSTSTTAIGLIRALTDARPIKPTSTRCPSARRPNPGRGSTYRRGNSVQTTAATSVHAIDKTLPPTDPLIGSWCSKKADSKKADYTIPRFFEKHVRKDHSERRRGNISIIPHVAGNGTFAEKVNFVIAAFCGPIGGYYFSVRDR